MQGRLVGVNSAGVTQRGERLIQGQNYAIGVDRVKEIVPDLAKGRSFYWVGVGLTYVPDPSRLNSSAITKPGIAVLRVVPGSPAAKAGWPKGSYISSINGQDLDGTLQGYCQAVKSGPSDRASFTVQTDANPAGQTLTIPFATSPPQ